MANEILARVRRLVPDMYYDEPLYKKMLDLLEFVAPPYDELREKALGLIDLSHLDDVPNEFLQELSKVIGYHWDESRSLEEHRVELRKAYVLYRVKSSPPSYCHILKYRGAKICDIFTPYLYLIRWSHYDSYVPVGPNGERWGGWSGIRPFQDSEYWRAGTYQIDTDIDPSLYLDDIKREVHPVGLKLHLRTFLTDIVDEQSSTLFDEIFVDYLLDYVKTGVTSRGGWSGVQALSGSEAWSGGSLAPAMCFEEHIISFQIGFLITFATPDIFFNDAENVSAYGQTIFWNTQFLDTQNEYVQGDTVVVESAI